MNRYIFAGIALTFVFVCGAEAEVPRLLHYQGTLLNAEGQAIHCPDDGTCEAAFNITFRLYAEEIGGDMLYEQTEFSVAILDGRFNVVLGRNIPIPLDVVAMDSLYMSLSINDEGEMEPRLRISSSAFALRAETAGTADKAADADTLGGQPPESFLSAEAAEALIDGKGFCEGPCYGDTNVEALLGDQGYTPFSGSYNDLSDTPDLSGYCAAPCYGDAQVQNYLTAQGYVPGPGYTDEDVAAYLSAQGFQPGAPYSDAQVQAYLDLMGYEAGPKYSDDDVAAYLAANGYAPGPYFSGSFADLTNVPEALGKLGVTAEGTLTFDGQPVVDSAGSWVGDATGLQGPKGDDADPASVASELVADPSFVASVAALVPKDASGLEPLGIYRVKADGTVVGRLISAYLDYSTNISNCGPDYPQVKRCETWVHLLNNGATALHTTNAKIVREESNGCTFKNSGAGDCSSVVGFVDGMPYIPPANAYCYPKKGLPGVVNTIIIPDNTLLTTTPDGIESLWAVSEIKIVSNGDLEWRVLELDYLGDIQAAQLYTHIP